MPWKRRPLRPRNLAQALNIADLRELARRRVPHFVFEYVEGGAEDEATLHANRRAFANWRLLPRTLIDTCARHTRAELFGRAAAAPLIIAPTGFNGMLSPEGDVALARGAATLGIPFTLSTFSTARLEDVATRAGGRLWLQLYVMKDRGPARELMRRAAAAGIRGPGIHHRCQRVRQPRMGPAQLPCARQAHAAQQARRAAPSALAARACSRTDCRASATSRRTCRRSR